MIKVGITGQAGFIGTHLYNYLGLEKDIERIHFRDEFFLDDILLRTFVKQCDVIVHLAAVNRHNDQNVLFDINIDLAKKLIKAMEAEKVKPHIVFSSSIQEKSDNAYGKSKKISRELFETWANNEGALFTGLIISNVYGPFGKPFYNSFIATFCYQLTHGEQPNIKLDSMVQLIYIGSLCKKIIENIKLNNNKMIATIEIEFDFESKVSDVLKLLEYYKYSYLINNTIPVLKSKDEINLFNTFLCFIDHATFYPKRLVTFVDNRGSFVETLKTGIGGQFSFSTTAPSVTRGNHYHTRKIERFIVIKGQAKIQMRKINSKDILEFNLNGDTPAIVDIPVWFTHCITNTGSEELYTQFWINEWYNENDPDTYKEDL